MKNLTANDTSYVFPDQTAEGTGRSCYFSGVSKALQINYFYYSNFVITPVTALLGLWCLLSNAYVLIVFLRAKLQMRSGFCTLVSLTLTDLLWAGLVIPLYTSFRVAELVSGKACANRGDWDNPLMVTSFFLCLLTTVGTLGVMSVDRYLAVSNPMWYKVTVNRRHIISFCCGVWLVSSFMVALKHVTWLPYKALELFEACYLVLFASVIIVVQVMTLVFLRKHNSAVANVNERGARANNLASTRVERQLTVITRHVVSLLGLIIIPVASSVALSHILGMEVNPFAEPLYFLSATLCSSINPLLYYRGIAQIREGIGKLAKCQ